MTKTYTKFLDSTHHVLIWSGIPIDMKARNFVKHIVQSKNFNNIFNSTHQQKVKQLSHQHEVDWKLTQKLIAMSSANGSTSFAQSNKKSFQVKCFTEELITLVKLQ